MTQLPKSHAGSLPNKTRRTLLKAGIAGGAALVLARWMVTSYPRQLEDCSVFASRVKVAQKPGAEKTRQT